MLLTLALLVLATTTAAPPAYGDYPAVSAYHGTPSPPDLGSDPMAKRYRSVLRESAKAGPNFAGHYTLVKIGCGSSCFLVAVVDAVDGHVRFPQGLRMIHWAGWWQEPYGPQYQVSSRLLMVYGLANTEDGPYGVSYFLWTGQDFTLLRFERRDPGKPPE